MGEASLQIYLTKTLPTTMASAASKIMTATRAARSSSTRKPALNSPQSQLAPAELVPTVSPSSCTAKILPTWMLSRESPTSANSDPMPGRSCKSLASTTTMLSSRVTQASMVSTSACAAPNLALSSAFARSKSLLRMLTMTRKISTTDHSDTTCTQQKCLLYKPA